jgi:hypothetical protein
MQNNGNDNSFQDIRRWFRRKLVKIAENLRKIDENRRKSTKIDENCRKLAKIAENSIILAPELWADKVGLNGVLKSRSIWRRLVCRQFAKNIPPSEIGAVFSIVSIV